MQNTQFKGYEDLANSIIKMAADDYMAAYREHLKKPDSKNTARKMTAIQHFFRSEWFSILTTVDPEVLIKGLQELVKNTEDKNGN